jgi:hypothetical protein
MLKGVDAPVPASTDFDHLPTLFASRWRIVFSVAESANWSDSFPRLLLP